MAPSAPLPMLPPVPLTAFLEGGGDGTVFPSDDNDTPTFKADVPPVIVAQPKLPGKSVLKRHSMFGSPQQLILQPSIRHTRSMSGQIEYGLQVSNIMEKDATGGGKQPSKAAAVVGNGVDVVVPTEAYIQCKRKDSRVTWTDNHGKDLAEVWEFEPSDTNDSDEESDGESSQACTCVIQ